MSFKKDFENSIHRNFPDRKIQTLGTQPNVQRLVKPGESNWIVKTVIAFADEPEEEEEVRDISFHTEVQILKNLPSWWGLRLVKAVKDEKSKYDHRLIVTAEIPNLVNWTTVASNTFAQDLDIVRQILKQLEWLHQNNIVHNDMELKNILLMRLRNGNYKPILIDFEKSYISQQAKDQEQDVMILFNSLIWAGLRRLAYILSLLVSSNRRRDI